MTRRIAAAFLAVLFVFVAVVVVPLGLVDSSRIWADYRAGAAAAARTAASLAEERLDDRNSTVALRRVLARELQAGDGVTILDPSGRPVAHAGGPVSSSDDRLLARAPIGHPAGADGTAILARSTQPVENRLRALWLALSGAALIVLLVGTLVAFRLGAWIATPLRSLVTAADNVGAGDVSARADVAAGPVQVREVGRAFNEMAERVSVLLERHAVMTADVSHQLRTPLAALRLRLDLLLTEVPDDLRDDVAGMIGETSRLSRLVDGLLAVARAESTLPTPRPIDVGAACAERARSWDPLAAERGVDLTVRSAPRALAIATPGHLEQILDNALANALDALPPGGAVAIDVTASPSTVGIRVADNGPGMSEHLRARAFDRFVTDRDHNGNTGLGLAIVGRLVAADHGRAELVDTPGGGLTLVVELPTARTR